MSIEAKKRKKDCGEGQDKSGSKAVPEIIDPVFAKTSRKRSFSMTEYERFRLVFTKTRVYKYRHGRGGG